MAALSLDSAEAFLNVTDTLLTSSYSENTDVINNVSLTSVFYQNLDVTSTMATEVKTVAESLKMTRFVVQTLLTPVVATVGLLGNFLNILVLFQPSMRTSTNVYLLVLSFADSVYLTFNVALAFWDCRKQGQPHSAYRFNAYGRFLSNLSGNIGVLVTVVFTVERYIAVCKPIHGKIWCTVRRAKLASLAVSIIALANSVPTLFEIEVVDSPRGPLCRSTALASTPSYEIGFTWWYVTCFTFVPMICLIIFNTLLIRALLVASRKRQQLVMTSSTTSVSGARGLSTMDQSSHGKLSSPSFLSFARRNGRSDPASKTDSAMSRCSRFYCRFKNHPNHSYSNNNRNHVRSDDMSQADMPMLTTTTTETMRTSPVSNSVTFTSAPKVSSTSCSGPDQSLMSPSTPNNLPERRFNKRASREHNKVTLMLVTIVMIFLLCQLPWTALFLYTTYLSSSTTGTKIAGNICNLLGLVNASVNFYLYSCFSKCFRRTLAKLVVFWRQSHHSPTIV